MALMMLDVDHSKSLNDSHGHHVGDQVLQRLVRQLQNVLQPGLRLAAAGPSEVRTTLPRRTVSIGVSALREGPDSVDAILLRADTALYRAKALGRDRIDSEA